MFAGQTDDDFQRFGGLHRADNAHQRREHAECGAGGIGAGRVQREQAGVAGRVGKVGAIDGKLPVKTHRRARYQRLLRSNGGGVNRLARGEIVAAIQYHIAAWCECCQRSGIQFAVRFNAAA